MQTTLPRRFSMMARLGLTISVLTALLCAPVAMAQSAGSPMGVWLTQAGDARVRVSKCGDAICGVVVWLRDPVNPANGLPMVDDKNPNPALAKRPMIGLPLFTDMRISGPNKWSGHIYNADDGGTYVSNISVSSPDTLRVEGCVGALCGGENWTRTGR
jgi:uncharacterized protein (DUF2147 family)